jgi:deazaflavin-dependent oxidoreductase (nitroreductase family)
MAIGADLEGHDYCYLTTTGRISGEPREIEIWFAIHGETVYFLSGGSGRSDWGKNLHHNPHVGVRIGDETSGGRARTVYDADEDGLARGLLFDKYSPRYSGDLERWRSEALPIAVDLDQAAA